MFFYGTLISPETLTANIIQKNKRDLALPSSFYGGLGLEELTEKVKFFIGTTLGKTENGFQNKGKPGPA